MCQWDLCPAIKETEDAQRVAVWLQLYMASYGCGESFFFSFYINLQDRELNEDVKKTEMIPPIIKK